MKENLDNFMLEEKESPEPPFDYTLIVAVGADKRVHVLWYDEKHCHPAFDVSEIECLQWDINAGIYLTSWYWDKQFGEDCDDIVLSEEYKLISVFMFEEILWDNRKLKL